MNASEKRTHDEDEELPGRAKLPKGSIPALATLKQVKPLILDLDQKIQQTIGKHFRRKTHFISSNLRSKELNGSAFDIWETTFIDPEKDIRMTSKDVDFCVNYTKAWKHPDGYWLYKNTKTSQDAVMLKLLFVRRPELLEKWLKDTQGRVVFWNKNGRTYHDGSPPIDGRFILFRQGKSVKLIDCDKVEYEDDQNTISSHTCEEFIHHVL